MKTLVILLLFIFFVVDFSFAQNWQPLGSPSIGSADVKDLAVGRTTTDQNPSVYFIQGSTIYRSTDGATTWTTTTPLAGTPRAVACKQSTPTWVVINYVDASSLGYVLYSSNNGTVWEYSNIFAQHTAIAIRIVTFPANQLIILMGMEKFNTFVSMKRSLNAGLTWEDVSYFFGNVQTDVVTIAPHKTNAKHVFAGGKTPPPRTLATRSVLSELPPIRTKGAFFSTDSGLNWDQFSHQNVNKNVLAMTAYKKSTSPHYNYVFAATEDGNLYRMFYRSTAAPTTKSRWIKIISWPRHRIIYDLQVDANNVLYAVTNNGVYLSRNNGIRWIKVDDGIRDISNLQRIGTDPQSASITFVGSPTNLYKTSDGARTWSNVTPNRIPGSAPPADDRQLLEYYQLFQNYPNPFNPVTRFEYALPEDAHVTLKIYNVLGQLVATVVDEFQVSGYKSIEWDAGGLTSGLYFYRFQAGMFTETKKLLLIR
ncbi:MAG: T9SS type A sorting domain-containing protein [Bacteroidota bacterium]|nr:T9SS type A sorting domain-containing protein [Bacteroidota bacterium]